MRKKKALKRAAPGGSLHRGRTFDGSFALARLALSGIADLDLIRLGLVAGESSRHGCVSGRGDSRCGRKPPALSSPRAGRVPLDPPSGARRPYLNREFRQEPGRVPSARSAGVGHGERAPRGRGRAACRSSGPKERRRQHVPRLLVSCLGRQETRASEVGAGCAKAIKRNALTRSGATGGRRGSRCR